MKVIENKGEYIFIDYDEPYTLNNLIALMKEASDFCAAEHSEKLLVSIYNMPGKVSTLDRFELGIQGTLIFRAKIKIALVYRKDELNFFAENVAVNRGMNARIFSDMNEAKNWLGIENS